VILQNFQRKIEYVHHEVDANNVLTVTLSKHPDDEMSLFDARVIMFNILSNDFDHFTWKSDRDWETLFASTS